MPETFFQLLRDWQGFYTLLGGAAATLTGLMFVAASLGARLLTDESDAKVRTFVTPTIIYFSLVLLLSALMNVPTQTLTALTVQLASVGLLGTGYSLSHLRRLQNIHSELGLDSRVWVWNLALPLLGSLFLAGAGFGLERSVSGALDVAAYGAMLLVMVGIHNAWDVTLFLARRTPA